MKLELELDFGLEEVTVGNMKAEILRGVSRCRVAPDDPDRVRDAHV